MVCVSLSFAVSVLGLMAADARWRNTDPLFGMPKPVKQAQLAPGWSAQVAYGGDLGGIGKDGFGVFHYDAVGQKWRMMREVKATLFRPNDTYVMDELMENITGFGMNMTLGHGKDAICKPLPYPYNDMFAWVPYASSNGTRTVDGQLCELWRLDVPAPNTQTLTICLRDDGAPLEYNQRMPATSHISQNVSMEFRNISVGCPGSAAFAPTNACATYPTPLCSGSDKTSLVEVYRVHGKDEPLQLENRNAGDALGDMSFLCAEDARATAAAFSTKLVSHWVVLVNASVGQYALCNYIGGHNVCFGGAGQSVGRESSDGLGIGGLQGQCSANDDVGTFYSFPVEGRCAAESSIGADGCTWGDARRIRSVEVSCVLARGLMQTCAEERGHAPFVRSAAIMEAALASSDPAKGGCPDAAIPSSAFCQDHPGCRDLHPADGLCCPVHGGTRLACCTPESASTSATFVV